MNTRNIAGIICRALNHVDHRLINHGIGTAFLVMEMLEESGKYEEDLIQKITFLSMLHDIGAYKTEEINHMLTFETEDIWAHSIYGYLFLKYLSPFTEYAHLILYHHLDANKLEKLDVPYQELIQCLDVADRTAVYLGVAGNTKEIKTYFESLRGTKFSGEVLELLYRTQRNRSIWERFLKEDYMEEVLDKIGMIELGTSEIAAYLKMIIFTIDFRSPFTVNHTITTTKISMELGRVMGLDKENIMCIRYGALLHDLGKIGIPVEILEFPGKLSHQAMNIMKTHVDITGEIIGNEIPKEIKEIALRHHEKLDGSGYPLGLKEEELTLNEKIVAIADIVSALRGKRSYKEAFEKNRIVEILNKMKGEGLLCPGVVEVMIEHYDSIMDNVMEYCSPILDIYDNINEEFMILKKECEQL